MSLYLRQQDLELKVPKRIAVVGCGGIGSWVAIYSAMVGVKEMLLFDDDVLEVHNLNRLPFSLEDVGKPKVRVVRDFILKLRPECTVFAYETKLTEFSKSLLYGCDVVFDCTDNTRAHEFIEKLWDEQVFTTLIRGSYNGEHITVAKNSKVTMNSWGERVDGYDIPSYVAPTSIVAGILVWLAVSKDAPQQYFTSGVLECLLKLWEG